MSPREFSADFAMFGSDPAGFGPAGVDTLQAIAAVAAVGELDAIDLAFPFTGEGVTLDAVRDALAQQRIRASAIHSVLYFSEFALGSFTNPDEALRERAREIVRGTVEAARALNVDYIKIWPGRDGYDYPFQVDHGRVWDDAVRWLAETADSAPDVRFAIEYKAKDPRTHVLFGNAARLLLAMEELKRPNLGIVVDFGHSLFAHETPADVIHLAHRHGRLFGVEFNDNFRASDDDFTAGAVHLMETIEFVHALRQVGFDGVWELDQIGTREDPAVAARDSVRTLRAIEALLDRMPADVLADAQRRHDALAAQRVIHGQLLAVADAPVAAEAR
jgi:xylose isomerase